jgi:hypothetical protein
LGTDASFRVLTPVVVAGWPAFSAAVAAAAASLGYALVDPLIERKFEAAAAVPLKVELEVENSEIVTSQLARDQRLSVARNGVVVTFSRDARGRASLCVVGAECNAETLRAMGQVLSGIVVQQYVYQRLLEEMRKRDFYIVENEVSEDRSVRIKVRRWDS